LQRPIKELKKFAKIELNPGEEKEVKFQLDNRDFSYYDSHRKMWIAESGEFTILVGASSADIRQTETVNLKSTQKIPLAFNEYTFIREYWDNKETREMLKKLVPNWIGWWIPEGKTMDEAEIMGFFIDHPIIKLPYLSKGEVTHEQIMELVEQTKKLTFTP
jgi:beta-glucosidase